MQDQLHSSQRETSTFRRTPRSSTNASGDIMFKTAEAEWCEPVMVLNLPNSCSTRERADGQAARLL